MKQTTLFGIALLAGLMFLVATCTSSPDAPTVQAMEGMDKATASNPDPACATAPTNWFPHAQTSDPAEGADSPFGDPNKTTNCDFHRWSWQKFLYLTRIDVNGRTKFENLYQINNELTRLESSSGIVLKDTTQAGNSSGTLYDRKSKPVYYSIHVNKLMYDFSQKYMDVFLKIGLANLASKGYDTLTYPVGCLEVKASWMLVSSMKPSELGNYYITTAHMGTSDGPLVNVALLGIHVVGRVANHPEFIWATFDHSMLAPTYNWEDKKGTAQVLATKNYAFYDAGKTADQCPMDYEAANAFGFKSIYQTYALGMAQSATDASLPTQRDKDNNANIVALDKSVYQQLSKETGPWMNYVYTGAIWIDPTVQRLKPNDKNMGKLTNANLRGSRALGNVTMETFEQPDAPSAANLGSRNCFKCHTTQDDQSGVPKVGYNLAISHVFTNGFFVRRNPTAKGTFL